MIGAIIYWDYHEETLTLVGGKKRWLSTFLFSLKAFNGTHIGLIGAPKIQHGYTGVECEEFSNIDDALKKWSKPRICVLVKDHPADIAPTNLSDYNHPDDIIYMVGGDYGDIEFGRLESYSDRCDFVHVEMEDETVPMWSSVILGIALRDKYTKGL